MPLIPAHGQTPRPIVRGGEEQSPITSAPNEGQRGVATATTNPSRLDVHDTIRLPFTSNALLPQQRCAAIPYPAEPPTLIQRASAALVRRDREVISMTTEGNSVPACFSVGHNLIFCQKALSHFINCVAARLLWLQYKQHNLICLHKLSMKDLHCN